MPALTLTASGHLTVSSTMADRLVAGVRARAGDPTDALPDLTPRERDILNSIASGDTVRQTARTLGIAQKTVENIQARLFRKLGVRNRSGAVALAHSLGLLDPEPIPIPTPTTAPRLAPPHSCGTVSPLLDCGPVARASTGPGRRRWRSRSRRAAPSRCRRPRLRRTSPGSGTTRWRRVGAVGEPAAGRLDERTATVVPSTYR